ncbi:glycosyltransferase family 25 protein [Methylobacterium sp. C33D]|uniref:glycosyltransferase family 25 protein n=1 Tax=Methylobacterium mesophilicum TaxID=39956 RepID=UPI002F2D0B88
MYCFGISLRRFRERHAYLSQHLAAVWGPQCEITGFEGPVPDPNAPSQPDLTAGQIGCAMSHMSAYERMIALDLPHALIVEDDVVLPPQIHQIVADIEATLRPGDVVQLFNWTEAAGPFSSVDAVTIGGYRLCLPMDMGSLGTTAAYVITRSAAEGILRANRPVAVTSDNWSYFFERGAVRRGRALVPNAVSRKPFESTIFTSRSRVAAFLKGSALLKPLFDARRRVLEERIAAKMLLVDETSPLAAQAPR